MVEDALVAPDLDETRRLVALLDANGVPIRAAIRVLDPDAGLWRLWLVPDGNRPDKMAFYADVAGLVSRNRKDLPNFDIGEIALMSFDDPPVAALEARYRVAEEQPVHLGKTMVEGYFLPAAIIVRLR